MNNDVRWHGGFGGHGHGWGGGFGRPRPFGFGYGGFGGFGTGLLLGGLAGSAVGGYPYYGGYGYSNQVYPVYPPYYY